MFTKIGYGIRMKGEIGTTVDAYCAVAKMMWKEIRIYQEKNYLLHNSLI